MRHKCHQPAAKPAPSCRLRPIVKGDEDAFSCHTRCAIIGRRFRALNRTDGERPHQAFVTPHLPHSDAGVPDPVRPDRVRAAAPDPQRLPGQSLAQRPDHRRAVDRHHPVVPPRHPAVSRSGLGQRLPQRRSKARRQAGTQDAGADGGDARRRAGRSGRHLGADHARLSRTRWRTGSTRRAIFRAISPGSWSSSASLARSGA